MFSSAVGREEHCKQISLVCVGSAHSVWATLGLLPLMACVLSQSTLLRLQVALQGNCLKQALGCMHFPGLSCSGSGSRVLHKGADLVGPAFCAIPGLSSSGDQVFGACRCPQLKAATYPLPCPSCLVFWVCILWGADLWLQPSRQMSTVQKPKMSWLVTKSGCSLV